MTIPRGQSLARTPALVGMLVVALGLTAACASSRPEERPGDDGKSPGRAILEVENRTPEDLSVSVRGRVEGVVRSGARLRIRDLAAGEVEVHARSLVAGAGAFETALGAALYPARIAEVSILPDAAGGPALPEVARLATLQVVNPSPRSIVVSLDGARLGRVFAGTERTFEDLPSGSARIMARPDDATASRDEALTLAPDTVTSWRFTQIGATLTIDNATDEAIRVTIDGSERARIAPNERWTSTEAPGIRLLSARSEPSRRAYEELLELTRDEPAVWRVTSGQGALEVENATGEPISLAIPGRPPTSLAAGTRERFEDLPGGPLAIEARGQHTRTIYAARLELLPGQDLTWVAGPVRGSIRVENRTARTLTIYAGADLEESPRGQLAPGATALVRELPRTNIRIAAIAIDAGGLGRRYATTIDLSQVPAATWVVSPVTGAIRVSNDSGGPVDVFVDALRRGEVADGQSRIFTGLETGPRRIECVGVNTRAVQREVVDINEEELATVAVRATTSWLLVDNATGEALSTRGVLATQLAEIASGASVRFRIPAGPQRLAVLGRDSGFVYARPIDAGPAEEVRWRVSLTSGRVIVYNRLAESVAVTIDGRAQGSLPPDESLALEEVTPGAHSVQVVGLRSGLVRGETVEVRPADDSKVTFSHELGSLLVENRSHEPVEVRIDGALYGTVSPSVLHAFGKVAPGAHRVELYFTASHRRQYVGLDVHEGQRARVVAEAPMGVVVVDNTSHQDVRVTSDGEVLATVPADAGPTLLAAPAGGRHIQVERLGDRTQLGFHLVLAADVAVHLPVPPNRVRLVVLNQGETPLMLFAGDRELGELAGHQSRMLEDLPDGEMRLIARDGAGRVTHEELRRLHSGETATWVLPPSH